MSMMTALIIGVSKMVLVAAMAKVSKKKTAMTMAMTSKAINIYFLLNQKKWKRAQPAGQAYPKWPRLELPTQRVTWRHLGG